MRCPRHPLRAADVRHRAPRPRLLGAGDTIRVHLRVIIGKTGHLLVDPRRWFLVGADPPHLTLAPCHGAARVRHLIALVRIGIGLLHHLEGDPFLPPVVVIDLYRARRHLANIRPRRVVVVHRVRQDQEADRP